MVYIHARIYKYIYIMNITKLNIIICFLLTALTASAMKYQIKVLNTPTITIDNKAAKVGDWFDDQSVIVWSRDNQAMRVVSEDNKVYTLSAKLYKESKSKKFSDFIIYTKPLAARGTNNLDLIEQLAERFDNTFVMLDKIAIDLSDVMLPKNCVFEIISKENKSKIMSKPKDGEIFFLRSSVNRKSIHVSDSIMKFDVFLYCESDSVKFVTDCLEIELLPL